MKYRPLKNNLLFDISSSPLYLCIIYILLVLVSMEPTNTHTHTHTQEWGVSQDMVIGTLTKESLEMWMEKGISNVAYLSLALGLDNTMSRAFIEAKVYTCIIGSPK